MEFDLFSKTLHRVIFIIFSRFNNHVGHFFVASYHQDCRTVKWLEVNIITTFPFQGRIFCIIMLDRLGFYEKAQGLVRSGGKTQLCSLAGRKECTGAFWDTRLKVYLKKLLWTISPRQASCIIPRFLILDLIIFKHTV